MTEKKVQKPTKKSVKQLQNEIRAKEAETQEYAKKFGASVKHFCGEVRTLKNNWKGYSKDLQEAAKQIREEGIENMKNKVEEFKNEILKQRKENQAAISRMKGDVQLFVSDINGMKRDFANYAKGPFAGYIKAFWG